MFPGMRVAKRTKDELAEAKKALNESFLKYKSIGQIAADPEFQYTAAELVRQIALDEFALSDPTPMFCDRESASLGQTLELEEVLNTMKLVRRHPGSKPLTFTPTKRKYPITTKQYDMPFGMDLEKILRRQFDASVFAEHAAQALKRGMLSVVLSAIDAAATGNDHYGRALRYTVATNVDQTSIEAAIRSLGDVNSDVTIIGRYYTLFPIMGLSGVAFSDVALEEFRQQGMIANYKGAKVVVVNDDFNFYYNSATIPANRIYVVGGRKGAKLHERDVSALNYQWMNTESTMLETGFRVDFGVTVLQPWRFRVIEIT